MALVAADLTYPTGEIRPEWFEGEDLPASLTVWLAAGAAIVPVGASEAQADAVARSYAYVRAYEAKALAIAGTPDSVALDGLSRTTSTSRAKVFLEKAAEWRAVFEALVADLTAPPVENVGTVADFRPSGSVERITGW